MTGGSGFIGSHIVDRLVKDDTYHEVIVIDNESATSNEKFYQNEKAKYYKVDVANEDTHSLYDGVDIVFHNAAESRIQIAITNPLLTFRTNIIGTANVLEASKKHSVKKVIYSSTSSSYGLKNKAPLTEDMTEDCLNVYSLAKVTGEKYCKIYHDLYGLKTITLRYFNVYGPREPLKGHYAPVVGKFLRQKRNNESLTIVGNGNQKRDFTYIDDVVEANMLAMNREHGHYGEVFNIGTMRNYSILELAQMISDNISYLPPRQGEAYITLADNNKAKNILGWVPKRNITNYIKEQLHDTTK